MTLAHIAGMPVEEWLMPFAISAGAVFVGVRAKLGSSQGSNADRERAENERQEST